MVEEIIIGVVASIIFSLLTSIWVWILKKRREIFLSNKIQEVIEYQTFIKTEYRKLQLNTIASVFSCLQDAGIEVNEDRHVILTVLLQNSLFAPIDLFGKEYTEKYKEYREWTRN